MCAITTSIIAASRERNAAGWFLIGMAMGIFGLVLVIVLPAAKRAHAPSSFGEAFPLVGAGRKPPGTGIQCPDCKQDVAATDRTCPHCSFRLA